MSAQGDAGVRARVAGKLAMAERVAWELHVECRLRIRCVRAQRPEDGFVVQARTEEGWKHVIATGNDAQGLLVSIASSRSLVKALGG